MKQDYTDELSIRFLLDKYTNAVNRRDWAAYRACWTNDAIWELHEPINVTKTGIEDILTEAKRAVESQELFVQMNHAVVVTNITENSAKTAVTLNEIGKARKDVEGALPGVEGMHILAFYTDELVKENGDWKFTKRVYDVVCIDFSAPKGEVYPLPEIA